MGKRSWARKKKPNGPASCKADALGVTAAMRKRAAPAPGKPDPAAPAAAASRTACVAAWANLVTALATLARELRPTLQRFLDG